MFVSAIEKVQKYTRPIHTLTRLYGEESAVGGAATLFFVNELGYAITCKHVTDLLAQADKVNEEYKKFSSEKKLLPTSNKFNKKLKELESKYGFKRDITVQIKYMFVSCVDKMTGFEIISHPTLDLAVIHFKGFEKTLYEGHATFLKDTELAKQGRFLCRLGYPFPEFTNYTYNKATDDIEWTQEGRKSTPSFPIEGMMTRNLLGGDGNVAGIELSTPGLRGQSGGPLFDDKGIIYGMQSKTHHLHLGFDIKDKEIYVEGAHKKVSNYPFMHLGACVHTSVIKSFLKEKNIKYYESE